MSNRKWIGTADFYYQVADDLNRLGVEFVILVREPGATCTTNIHNVNDVDTANIMHSNLEKTFDAKFGRTDEPET